MLTEWNPFNSGSASFFFFPPFPQSACMAHNKSNSARHKGICLLLFSLRTRGWRLVRMLASSLCLWRLQAELFSKFGPAAPRLILFAFASLPSRATLLWCGTWILFAFFCRRPISHQHSCHSLWKEIAVINLSNRTERGWGIHLVFYKWSRCNNCAVFKHSWRWSALMFSFYGHHLFYLGMTEQKLLLFYFFKPKLKLIWLGSCTENKMFC